MVLSSRFLDDGKPTKTVGPESRDALKYLKEKLLTGEYTKEIVTCCICSNQGFDLLSGKDRYGISSSVVICKKCGLVQLNPRMNQDAYNKFYESYYRKIYGSKTLKEYFEFEQRRGKSIFEFVKKNSNIDLEGCNVLEIGCGAGGNLDFFRNQGCDVVGCDLGEEYLEYGRTEHNLNLHLGTFDSVDLPWKPDLVIFSHILEHMLRPTDEMKAVRDRSHDSTVLYVEVPGFRNRLPKSGFLPRIHIAHTYYFDLASLQNLMGQAGFRLIHGNEYVRSLFVKNSKSPSPPEELYKQNFAYIQKFKHGSQLKNLKKKIPILRKL